MSRNFDGELANQTGASYRSENNNWAQDWLTNRSGAGVPGNISAYGTYFNITDGMYYVRDASNVASKPLFDADGYITTRDGTVAAPAHGFSSDGATGAYLPTTGVYSIAAAGVQTIKFAATAITAYFPVTINNASADALVIHHPVSSGGWGMTFTGLNASSGTVSYAAWDVVIQTNTAGAEDSYAFIRVMKAGTLTSHTVFKWDGTITTGTVFTQLTNANGTIRHAALEQNGATAGQQLTWNGTTWAPDSAGGGGSNIGGSGTANYIPKFTASTTLGNSVIQDQGDGVYIAGNLEITGILLAGSGVSPTNPITNAAGEIRLDALAGGAAVLNNVIYHNGSVWTFGSIADISIDLTTDVTGVLPDANVAANLTINAGTIEATPIGAVTPSSGAFTTLSATGNTTFGDASTDTHTITGVINPTANVQFFRTSGGTDHSNILLEYNDLSASLVFRDATTQKTVINETGVGLKANAQNWSVYTSGVTAVFSVVHTTSTTGEVVVNDASHQYNFRVESDGNANAIFVDSVNNRVGILNGSPAVALDVTGAVAVSLTLGVTGITTLTGGALIGNATALTFTAGGATTTVQQITNTDTAGVRSAVWALHATSSGGPNIGLLKGRGTLASPTIVANGDTLGSLLAYGYDGVDYEIGGRLSFVVDSTPGSGDMPTSFVVSLCTDGGVTLTNRLTISNAGVTTLNGGLAVTGAASCTTTMTITTGLITSAFSASRAVNIASGTLAVTSADLHIVINAESGTADTLDTITGGTAGQHLYINSEFSDTITITNLAGGTGDILTATAANLSMVWYQTYHLIYDAVSTIWVRVL